MDKNFQLYFFFGTLTPAGDLFSRSASSPTCSRCETWEPHSQPVLPNTAFLEEKPTDVSSLERADEAQNMSCIFHSVINRLMVRSDSFPKLISVSTDVSELGMGSVRSPPIRRNGRQLSVPAA